MSFSKPHSSSFSPNADMHGHDVEIFEMGPTETTIPPEPRHCSGEGTNGDVPNKKSKWVIAGMIGGSAAVLCVGGTALYQAGANSKAATTTLVSASTAIGGKSSKVPGNNKPGKKVCLEYGFLNDVVIKGSSTPIGGPTNVTPGCLVDGAACLADFTAGGDYNSDGCKKYLKCLGKKDNGPSFIEPWYFNRDVSFSAFVFEDGKVCASVPGTELNSKTSMELWEQDLIGERLDRFREFKVDYKIENSGAGNSVAFVNFYVRTGSARTTFYDCNFVFLAPDATTGAEDTIVIDLDTSSSSARRCTSSGCLAGNTADDNGCVNGNSINDYITANSNAVFGVGNKEWYSFVLTNGSTNQDNQGLDVCWSDVRLTRVDGDGTQIINTYEFTALN